MYCPHLYVICKTCTYMYSNVYLLYIFYIVGTYYFKIKKEKNLLQLQYSLLHSLYLYYMCTVYRFTVYSNKLVAKSFKACFVLPIAATVLPRWSYNILSPGAIAIALTRSSSAFRRCPDIARHTARLYNPWTLEGCAKTAALKSSIAWSNRGGETVHKAIPRLIFASGTWGPGV